MPRPRRSRICAAASRPRAPSGSCHICGRSPGGRGRARGPLVGPRHRRRRPRAGATGGPTLAPARRTPDDRVHIEPRLVCSDPACPLRAAVLAPLLVQEKRAGTLIVFYREEGHHAPRGGESGPRGGGARLGPDRPLGARRTGGAARAGRAQSAASPDLAPLHLRRARRAWRRHPCPPGGGTSAAERLRRVHTLPVPRRPSLCNLADEFEHVDRYLRSSRPGSGTGCT